MVLTCVTDQQKDDEKRIKAEAKAAEKARKEQEKAAKAEEKRRAKEEKHKSKEVSKPIAADLKEQVAEEDRHDATNPSTETAALVAPVLPPATGESTTATAPAAVEASPAEVEESKVKGGLDKETKPEEKRKSGTSKFLKKPLALDLRKRQTTKEDQEQPPATAPLERREPVDTTTSTEVAKERSQSFSGRRGSNSPPLDDESRSGTNKLKSWFSSHFSRPRTKSAASASGAEEKSSSSPDTAAAAATSGEAGFVGGAALRRRPNSSGSASSSASSASSLRDVAFASVSPDATRKEQGLPSTTAAAAKEASRSRSPSPARSVSSVSRYSEGDDDDEEGKDTFEEAREDLARTITPPPAPRDPASFARSGVSPARGSRFSEVLD
jgi:hypothetical protein